MSSGLPYNPLKNMMNGKPTSCFTTKELPVDSGNADVMAAVEYAKSSVTNAIANITSFSAAKLGETAGELLAPPMPQDILDKAAEIMSSYLMTPDEILQELLKPAEKHDEEKREESLQNNTEEFAGVKDNKLGELENKISYVVDFITVELPKITDKAIQGTKWVDEQIKYYENLAMQEIEKSVDDNTQFLIKAKEDMINSLASGIAEQTATTVNEDLRKTQKRKLDKIKETRDKAIVEAKAAAGSVLLNLMAKLGL